MMTKEQILSKFDEYYDVMAQSKEVANMHAFGKAFRRLMERTAEMHPSEAEKVIEQLEVVMVDNFVTIEEAKAIAEQFINDDTAVTGMTEDSRGAKWTMSQARSVAEAQGYALSDGTRYNWPALWVAVNMIYSDFIGALAEWLPERTEEEMFKACHALAIKRLTDPDRPRWIRRYFDLD